MSVWQVIQLPKCGRTVGFRDSFPAEAAKPTAVASDCRGLRTGRESFHVASDREQVVAKCFCSEKPNFSDTVAADSPEHGFVKLSVGTEVGAQIALFSPMQTTQLFTDGMEFL